MSGTVSKSRFALVVMLAFGCSPPTIPEPVTVASAKMDDQSAAPNPANADPLLRPPFGPFDIQTAFYISKSNDRDRVDYGMRLDQHCAPVGDEAVFPYWRELEHAPPVRSHPITFFQNLAYGFSDQHVLSRAASGGQYHVQLKQVERPILIVTSRDASAHCKATTYTEIKGSKNAKLDHIFVKVAGAMSIDYLDIFGSDPKTGAPLVERLQQ
jgi:hypothetical protein